MSAASISEATVADTSDDVIHDDISSAVTKLPVVDAPPAKDQGSEKQQSAKEKEKDKEQDTDERGGKKAPWWMSPIRYAVNSFANLSSAPPRALDDVMCVELIPFWTRSGVFLPMSHYYARANGVRGAEPLPVILIRTPYDREWMRLPAERLAAYDYHVIVQDTRGRADDGEGAKIANQQRHHHAKVNDKSNNEKTILRAADQDNFNIYYINSPLGESTDGAAGDHAKDVPLVLEGSLSARSRRNANIEPESAASDPSPNTSRENANTKPSASIADKSPTATNDHDDNANKQSEVYVPYSTPQFGECENEGVEFFPIVYESEDGLETLDWLKRQPWCSGKIGTFGPSYLGITQWALVDHCHPLLKCIVPTTTASNMYNMIYPNGVLSLDLCARWLYIVFQIKAVGLPLYKRMWRRVVAQETLDRAVNTFPLINLDVITAGRALRFWREMIAHASDPSCSYWRQRRLRLCELRSSPPIHILEGWYDLFLHEALADYQSALAVHKLQQARYRTGQWTPNEIDHEQQSPTIKSKKPYLTIGQLAHFTFDKLYFLSFEESVRWYDVYLKGKTDRMDDRPPTQAVKIEVMGINQWRFFGEFPPPARYVRWFLQPDKSLSVHLPSYAEPCPLSNNAPPSTTDSNSSDNSNKTNASEQSINVPQSEANKSTPNAAPAAPLPEPPKKRWWQRSVQPVPPPVPMPTYSSSYLYNPRDPTPVCGGATFDHNNCGPIDNRPIEKRKDILVFTSEPLVNSLSVAGYIRATVYVSSTCASADFIVRLLDVHPKGQSFVLCDGIVRVTPDMWHTQRVALVRDGAPLPVNPSDSAVFAAHDAQSLLRKQLLEQQLDPEAAAAAAAAAVPFDSFTDLHAQPADDLNKQTDSKPPTHSISDNNDIPPQVLMSKLMHSTKPDAESLRTPRLMPSAPVLKPNKSKDLPHDDMSHPNVSESSYSEQNQLDGHSIPSNTLNDNNSDPLSLEASADEIDGLNASSPNLDLDTDGALSRSMIEDSKLLFDEDDTKTDASPATSHFQCDDEDDLALRMPSMQLSPAVQLPSAASTNANENNTTSTTYNDIAHSPDVVAGASANANVSDPPSIVSPSESVSHPNMKVSADRICVREGQSIIRISIDMWATANVFKAGHRVRLHVCSAAHPRWLRNFGGADPFHEGLDRAVSAVQTVFHCAELPSCIHLPVTLMPLDVDQQFLNDGSPIVDPAMLADVNTVPVSIDTPSIHSQEDTSIEVSDVRTA